MAINLDKAVRGGEDKVQTESFVRLVVKQDIMQGG